MMYEEKMVSDEIKRLAPVLGRENAVRLSRAYLISDEKTRKRIVEMVDMMKAAVYSDKDLRDAALVEPPEMEDGEIKLGSVIYGRKKMFPLSIKKETFMTHVGIFGSSGYGKTNTSFLMVKNLAEQGIPVIIFDFSKRNYRDLMQTDLRDRIQIFTIGRNVAPFRFNPLKPPKGIGVAQWIKEFASVFDHAYWLLGGGQNIIMKALDELYQTKKNPRLSDLKNIVDMYESMTSRERNWIATAKRPLESLCFREINDVFDCDHSDLSRFFVPGRITIIELDALSVNDKTFFIEIMLQWIRDWLITTQKREELIGVVVLEEAHHVLNREKARKLGSETVIDLLFREVRELGLGMIYIDQHPSLVSYPAMGNTSAHVYMNLGLDTKQSSDIMDASNMLGLDYKEEGDYLRRLPVGHGFMLIRNIGSSRPFLVEFEKMEIEKGRITDEDVAEAMKDKISTQIKEEPVDFDFTSLTETEEKIISAIGLGKGLYTSQLYKALKMSGSTFNDNMKTLARAGIVDQRGVKIKKARAVYYFLTDLGEAIFSKTSKESMKDDKIDEKAVLRKFTEAGFKAEKTAEGFDIFKDEKEIKLSLISNYNRNAIYRTLRRDGYYIYASHELRNVLLQEACRFAKKKGSVRIFMQSAPEFIRSGGFEGVML